MPEGLHTSSLTWVADIEGSEVLTAADSLLSADQRRLPELHCGVLVDA